MSHPPCSPDLVPSDFFFLVFPMKKVFKRKCFADVEEVKQKTAETLKGTKQTHSKTVLSSGKKISIGVLHQMGSSWKGTEV